MALFLSPRVVDGEKGGGRSLTKDQDEDAPDDTTGPGSDKAVYGSRKQSNNEANKDPNSRHLSWAWEVRTEIPAQFYSCHLFENKAILFCRDAFRPKPSSIYNLTEKSFSTKMI